LVIGLLDLPIQLIQFANLNNPITRLPNYQITQFLKLARLNAIVDADVAHRAGWTALDLAAAYLQGGATFLQLRAKALGGSAFLDLAIGMRELAERSGATVIVNDRADISRLSGAAGVHVGQDDLNPTAARRIVGPDAIVGLSTHTREQIDAAVSAPVTYIAVGPVFGTSTKLTGYEAVGLDTIRYAAARAGRPDVSSLASRPPYRVLAVVAIGGIRLETAAEVIDAGATSVAVITDLLIGGDPEARVRAYVARLEGRGGV
jgi:thiamine-phosphate pyrophosphorylase